MSRHNAVSEWSQTVSTHFPHLSRPHAQVLALWSYGIALTHTCGMTTVVVLLAQLLGQRENTVRQR
jgi:membrane associated rhomboid family serine protease